MESKESKKSEAHSEHSHKRKRHSSKKNITSSMRKNPWMVSTFVLAILVVIMLIFGSFGSGGATTVSSDKAGQSLLEFANSQGADAQLVDVNDSDIDNFYEVTLLIQGQNIPIYVTKDGEYFTSSLIPLTTEITPPANTEQTSTSIPKSDIPVVELFVWGYCPYGVQAQGPLAEVASLLGNYANFSAVMYYDGHGPFETQENKIEECIQQVAPEKYWNYAAGFVETIYPKCSTSKSVDCDKTEAVKLMNSLGINSNAVLKCVDEQGEDLIAAASSRASQLGVTGSPTIVINGVKASPSARTAEAFKQTVCDAFTEGSAPEACSTELDSTAAAAAGNC